MTAPFAHLHVASGFSLRHGASLPEALVVRAAEAGLDLLALTDRDGLYGAVRFVQACTAAGIRPVLGADLAVEEEDEPGGRADGGRGPADRAAARRAGHAAALAAARGPADPGPARGGRSVDPRLPRVTVLARGRAGWGALCRLVSAAHERGARRLTASGARRHPTITPELVGRVAAAAGEGSLVVLLGPDSPPGRAAAARGTERARALLGHWRRAAAPAEVVVEVVSHLGPPGLPYSTGHAARMLGLAREAGLPAVLTNQVRYARPEDAPVADVLDAARRLVPLDLRHRDRVNAEGHLKDSAAMAAVAEEVARAAGTAGDAPRLLAATRHLAESLALDPLADLGMGSLHMPEPSVLLGGAHVPGGPEGQRLAAAELRHRCEAGLTRRYGSAPAPAVLHRLDEELALIDRLGYHGYFLTVAEVVDLTRAMGVRCAARGSGAGSLVNHLIGISQVDPIRHGLLMERFLSDRRAALPDIDLDVESARRTEVYRAVLDRFGGRRCLCVSMRETYRARHAIRDVGAALGLPPEEIDAAAKAFPHIPAREVRAALRELPELRSSRFGDAAGGAFPVLFDLVERLDGLPRHIALHPSGVLLSDSTLRDRTPVEDSAAAPPLGPFPMSQFDKDDVEELGLLKLDILGVRMQSAMAHAVAEVARVGGERVDLDAVPDDDPRTFELIRSTRTLGCFQIESPGQRELIGRFGPRTFEDLIVDISLFRPGPVKGDMVTPFLQARQGWEAPRFPHPDLRAALAETEGVVVYHEQVIRVIAVMTGCDRARADEARRALGKAEGQERVRDWFCTEADRRGYDRATVTRVWEVLASFGSFGFCKAHAAAFAVPTYQSAWLKAHHPAAFLAGVLTHDPGMYPKRLILDDARQFGIPILGLDVNRSAGEYRVEEVADAAAEQRDAAEAGATEDGVAEDGWSGTGRLLAIRIGLADVKGISEAEVRRVVERRAEEPYRSLEDFQHRAAVSRPVLERLILAGALDSLHGIGPEDTPGPDGLTRRDLLLRVGETARGGAGRRRAEQGGQLSLAMSAEQLLAARSARGSGPGGPPARSGLPSMTAGERVRAELEVLGLDVSRHLIDFYGAFLDELGVTRARDLHRARNASEHLVAGVKVATQTPPVRSGRRVVFASLDDATGPVDLAFFDDMQELGAAATVFHSWLLLARGVVRRTGPRGLSLRATGCWELTGLHRLWREQGIEAVRRLIDTAPRPERETAEERRRRVLVHPSGFRQSPYADLVPPGEPVGNLRHHLPKGRLWHSSPGSAG
ncbi:DNA polymerase III subunit alpha [Allostreptomyces psammosilenae]|uniref:DNA-directed DNA polymerase n=1 Tax=Allostreptomyces psammosilenae TaxID=1892865 RepID=A0A853A2H7_9ACTN|nr:DNA polymerase III subunit alpha [Allostreptomyces psammosilenae]NYI07084.1 error-prone DNA polymerase [Allostreptomyces psammosilenae]